MTAFSPQILLGLIKQLEALEKQKQGVTDEINETLKEAHSNGIDKGILKKILALRKRDPEKIQQEEDILQVYLDAIQRAERIYANNDHASEKPAAATIGFQEKKATPEENFSMNTF